MLWIILAVVALAALSYLAGWHARGHADRNPPPGLTGVLTIMSKIIHVGGAGTTASVAYTTKEGAPAAIVGVPVWTTTPADGSVITVMPAADGLSAAVAAVGVGSATITVTAEGDETPGVDTITLTGDVEVAAEEASAGTLTFA